MPSNPRGPNYIAQVPLGVAEPILPCLSGIVTTVVVFILTLITLLLVIAQAFLNTIDREGDRFDDGFEDVHTRGAAGHEGLEHVEVE